MEEKYKKRRGGEETPTNLCESDGVTKRSQG